VLLRKAKDDRLLYAVETRRRGPRRAIFSPHAEPRADKYEQAFPSHIKAGGDGRGFSFSSSTTCRGRAEFPRNQAKVAAISFSFNRMKIRIIPSPSKEEADRFFLKGGKEPVLFHCPFRGRIPALLSSPPPAKSVKKAGKGVKKKEGGDGTLPFPLIPGCSECVEKNVGRSPLFFPLPSPPRSANH